MTRLALILLAACHAAQPTTSPDAITDGAHYADARIWDPSPQATFPDPSGRHPTITLHAPADYASSSDRARPLVLFLHPYGYGEPYAGWAPIEASDVLYFVPQGALDSTGGHYWNASIGACLRCHRCHRRTSISLLGSLFRSLSCLSTYSKLLTTAEIQISR